MTLRAEQGVYLAIWLVVIAFLLLFFYMGPVGWVIGVFVFLAVLKFTSLSDVFAGEPSEPKRNCPDCGARNAVDNEICSYCGISLSDT